MGKDNGNTTNSWLNMAKVLELCINDGNQKSQERSLARVMKKTDVRTHWNCFRISARSSMRTWKNT